MNRRVQNSADEIRNKSLIIGLLAVVLILVSVPAVFSQNADSVGWHSTSSPVTDNLNSVVTVNETTAWVVGDGGTILYTSDAGKTWISEDSGVTVNLLEVDYNTVPVVVGEGGVVLIRENDIWVDISIAGAPDLNSVEIVDYQGRGQAEIFIAGDDGKIYKGNGITFNESSTGVTSNLNGISFYDSLNGLAVGDGGKIIGTTDGGENWLLRDTPANVSTTNFNDVILINDVRAYIVGDSGVFLRSSYQVDVGIGFDWQIWESGTDVNLHSLDGSSVNKIWMVGDNATVTLTRDGGSTFNPQKKDVITSDTFRDISFVNADVGFLVGDSGLIFYTNTGGIAESSKPTAQGFDDFFEYAEYANPRLWEGLQATIKIVIFSIFFGFTIGVTLAIFKTSRVALPVPIGTVRGEDQQRYIRYYQFNPFSLFANIYTNIFRNTPLLVQFLFIHFGLFEAGIDLTQIFFTDDRAYLSAIVALSLNSGAYQAEIIRSGIQAIPVGQMEAGRSLGLSYIQTMRYIIMPQAIRIVIPPLGNELVNLVLNSSLAFTIGYAELTRQGRLLIAISFKTFWTWGLVLLYYFAVTFSLSNIMRYVERKTKIPGLGFGGEI